MTLKEFCKKNDISAEDAIQMEYAEKKSICQIAGKRVSKERMIIEMGEEVYFWMLYRAAFHYSAGNISSAGESVSLDCRKFFKDTCEN